MRRLLLSVAVVVLISGCFPPKSTGTSEMTIVSGVPPFVGQVRDDDCASVALASLLAHAGHAVPPSVIDAAVYDPRLRGSLLPDLENFAAARGASPHSGRGTLQLLREQLRSGRPVLMPIDLGWSLWRRPHYIVVYGFDHQDFLLHVREGKTTVMRAEKLEGLWAPMGHLYLYLE